MAPIAALVGWQWLLRLVLIDNRLLRLREDHELQHHRLAGGEVLRQFGIQNQLLGGVFGLFLGPT
jgi:hypothetical protein